MPSPSATSPTLRAAVRRIGWEATSRTPAKTPRCLSLPSGSTTKRPFTEKTSTAETRNDAAFAWKATVAPKVATSNPPHAAPINIPADELAETTPFAHPRRSAGTIIATSALDAGENGASAMEAAADNATSTTKLPACAIAKKHAAAATSEAIMTRRRSKRSPSDPAHGLTATRAAKAAISAAANQLPDPCERS